MKRTFCTIIKDSEAEKLLGPMAEVLSAARHWSFREIYIRKVKLKDVKRSAIEQFGITARHFNGIRFELQQAVNGWGGGLEYRRDSLRDRIKDVSKEISGIEKKLKQTSLSNKKKRQLRFKLHQKKRHLAIQQDKLARVEKDLQGPPRICFGGRDLLRRGEVWEWREARSSRICLVGSGDETAGNQTAQWDGEKLKIRLPNDLGGKFVTLGGVTFRYGQEELLQALNEQKPFTWLLFRDEQGRWQARVTIEQKVAEVTCDADCGIIGVDLNVDHLAVVMVDRMGNPVGRESIPFPVAGIGTDKADGMLAEAIKRLTDIALERGCAIAVEKLDFVRKKANLKSFGKKHARRLSGFAYGKFFTMLEARCERLGIDLRAVNPAYTSVIGKTKYAPGRAMSAHHAAALVIGRRAMGFGERFVCMLHGTLDGPARNSPRHVWRRWRGVRRRLCGGVPNKHPSAPQGRWLDANGKRRASQARASAAEGFPQYGESSHGGRTPSGQPSAWGAVAWASTTSAVTADT